MTFNSLLMFDIVFVFFLFLVGVTCLVYYLPPSKQSISHFRVNHNSSATNGENVNGNGDDDDDDNDGGGGGGNSDGTLDYSRRMQSRCHRQCYHHHHHNAQNHYHVQQRQQINNPTNFHCEHHSHDHNHERLKTFNCKHHHKHCAANYQLLSNNIEFYTPQYSSQCDERYEVSLQIPPPPSPPLAAPPFCYIKAKRTDVKNGAGPIEDV